MPQIHDWAAQDARNIVSAAWRIPVAAALRAAEARGREAASWQPIETAPKDGTSFWGAEAGSAISMFWHPEFNEFVSAFRRMTMAPGYTIDDRPYKDHSPVVHKPSHWMPVILLPAALAGTTR